MDKFLTIQKEVFRFCGKLTDSEFASLADSFLFESPLTSEGVVGRFIKHCECERTYKLHLEDLEKNPYFLKCAGSDLYYIENLKTALLVYSYNRWKNAVGI
jgi:hypothetical protein